MSSGDISPPFQLNSLTVPKFEEAASYMPLSLRHEQVAQHERNQIERRLPNVRREESLLHTRRRRYPL